MAHRTRYNAQPGISLPTPRLTKRINAAPKKAGRASQTRHQPQRSGSQFKYTPAKRFDGGPVLPKKV
jgi:hypothetical protein